ncbi:MAG: leucine-rich repeat domain-containing protein [Candidatus Uhrbacteria bacterium]
MKQLLIAILSITLLGAGCSSPAQTSTSGLGVLSGQKLTSIPMEVFSRTELTTLDLSNNALKDAPQSQIGQLKNLQTLDLSNNMLTGLPAELGQLNKLQVLNVSNNKLTGLPMELGNLTQLQVLDITGNPYSTRDLDEIAKKLTHTEIRR